MIQPAGNKGNTTSREQVSQYSRRVDCASRRPLLSGMLPCGHAGCWSGAYTSPLCQTLLTTRSPVAARD